MKRRRSLLIEEPPMQVLPSLAAAIGLEEALFLQQLHYWLQGPNRRQHLGYSWIYNTYEEWLEQFPFWTYQTLQRTVTSVESMGIVIAKQLDRAKWERRKWYTIDYEAVELLTDRIDEVITSSREARSRSKEHAGRTTVEHIKLIHSIVSNSSASNISNWYVQEDQIDTFLKEQETTSIDYSKRENAAADAAPAPQPKAERKAAGAEPKATRLTVDALPDTWRDYAQTARADLDAGAVWEDFRDYWIAQPGQRGVKANWQATWQTWVRKTDLGRNPHLAAKRAAAQPAQRERIDLGPYADWVRRTKAALETTDPRYQELVKIQQRRYMTPDEFSRLNPQPIEVRHA